MAALLVMTVFLWALLLVGILILGNWLVLGGYLFLRDLVMPRVRRMLGLRDPWNEPPFPYEQP